MQKLNIVNRIVMYAAGGFLIFAALMKAHQITTEPIVSEGFWESWLFFVIQIPLELGLGVWMVSGLFRKFAWLFGTVSYFGFIFVTLQKGLTGQESCGCFGTVHVDPWITLFAIDIPFFLGLALFRPRGEKWCKLPSWDHLAACAVPTLALMGVLVVWTTGNQVEAVTVDPNSWVKAGADQENTESSDDVSGSAEGARGSRDDAQEPGEARPEGGEETKPAEEPDEPGPDEEPTARPVENEWPMLEYIDIADQIREGMTITLMFHHDCPTCTEAMPEYSKRYEQLGGRELGIKLAFVNIPPRGDPEAWPIPEGSEAMVGRLAQREAGEKWLIGTPLIVVTVDGEVVRTWNMTAPPFEELIDAAFAGG